MGGVRLARAKTTLKDLKPKPTKPDVNIICTKCGIEKKAKDDFYMSRGTSTIR